MHTLRLRAIDEIIERCLPVHPSMETRWDDFCIADRGSLTGVVLSIAGVASSDFEWMLFRVLGFVEFDLRVEETVELGWLEQLSRAMGFLNFVWCVCRVTT